LLPFPLAEIYNAGMRFLFLLPIKPLFAAGWT
jgi:hypothetical protein